MSDQIFDKLQFQIDALREMQAMHRPASANKEVVPKASRAAPRKQAVQAVQPVPQPQPVQPVKAKKQLTQRQLEILQAGRMKRMQILQGGAGQQQPVNKKTVKVKSNPIDIPPNTTGLRIQKGGLVYF